MPAPTLPPRRGREPKTPRQANVTGAQSDEQATSAHPDRSTFAEPAERHTRDHRQAALDAITEARTTGGTQGTTYALTAIAHAILAGQEPRP